MRVEKRQQLETDERPLHHPSAHTFCLLVAWSSEPPLPPPWTGRRLGHSGFLVDCLADLYLRRTASCGGWLVRTAMSLDSRCKSWAAYFAAVWRRWHGQWSHQPVTGDVMWEDLVTNKEKPVPHKRTHTHTQTHTKLWKFSHVSLVFFPQSTNMLPIFHPINCSPVPSLNTHA